MQFFFQAPNKRGAKMIQQIIGGADQHQTLALFGNGSEATVHLKTVSHSEEKLRSGWGTVSKLIH
jgi:hypothetical protein